MYVYISLFLSLLPPWLTWRKTPVYVLTCISLFLSLPLLKRHFDLTLWQSFVLLLVSVLSLFSVFHFTLKLKFILILPHRNFRRVSCHIVFMRNPVSFVVVVVILCFIFLSFFFVGLWVYNLLSWYIPKLWHLVSLRPLNWCDENCDDTVKHPLWSVGLLFMSL